MVLYVKIDQEIAEKLKVKHQSVSLGTPYTFTESHSHY